MAFTMATSQIGVQAAAQHVTSAQRKVSASVGAPRIVSLQKAALINAASKSAFAAGATKFSAARKASVKAARSGMSVMAQAVAAEAKTELGKAVYVFGAEGSDGDASMKMLLGGKGANLAEMSNIGLSTPPGFTITTDTCAAFHTAGCQLPEGVWEEVLEALPKVESQMGAKLGDAANPLLLSVRSGAAVSMPGMMDTVLNLGLNDVVVEGLAAKAGERFAYDSYRRFLDMFGNVVMGVPHELFEHELEEMKKVKGVENDNDLSADDLKELVVKFKAVYDSQGVSFPEDPLDQMREAIYAVFNSWNSERAIKFRNIQGMFGLNGTAVNVQSMVFGNMGETSGTGVCFTRDPSKGDNYLYGEYLVNAQGEDVVAGIRTPEPVSRMEKDLPEAYKQLLDNVSLLEKHYGDMQDIEFTVQEGRLWMLQCRSGKRTGKAAVKIACDMVREGLIDKETAVFRVEPDHLDQLLHPQFEDEEAASYKEAIIGSGLPASPGAAVGQVVFSSEAAEEMKAQGKSAILVRVETSPEDVGGMHSAEGILTQRGGMTSHAAVVARGWGKTCVCGCSDLSVNEAEKTFTLGGKTVAEGDWMSLNGSTGEILVGKAPMSPAEISGDLAEFMAWVDEARRLDVYANADTPDDAAVARTNGAQGIGLCRTEHMFFGSGARILAVRKMIMAETTEKRQAALTDLLPFQREDFEGIFKAMDGCPVTVRLLDPPLHEFLPEGEMEEICETLSKDVGMTPDEVADRIEKLSEVNPMLGFRGCRLAITYPEIAEMQVRAIMEAAINVKKEGCSISPDIMVPLTGTPNELKNQADLIKATAAKVFEETGVTVDYRIGTMIEIPRAALVADEVAEIAEFFSFGTNDLTQMTFGYSRDDVNKFLPEYIAQGILQQDPFQVLDQRGVGQLVAMATEKGRSTRADLKVGICGEHGGEPSSVDFFNKTDLNYVSCSPFRVPIARLAAAQSQLNLKK